MVQNPVWKQKKNGRIHATGRDRAFVIIVYALLAAVLLTALNRLLTPGCENNLSKPQSEENEVLRILSKRRSGA